MRSLLICHEGDRLNREGVARWMASFSDLAGIVSIRERSGRLLRRVRRELDRVGPLRFLDVLAYRLYRRLAVQPGDEAWKEQKLEELRERYPPVPDDTPVHATADPNSEATEAFISELEPDLTVARCKILLDRRIFDIPEDGTFVMHPGICPEYRNAHGCFWALARDDLENVGMTLLRIDEGVDTGPVYGYYSYDFDPVEESPEVIMYRVVLENLGEIAERLREVHRGEADPIDTSGRESEAWGQPWLTEYLALKRRARRRRRAG